MEIRSLISNNPHLSVRSSVSCGVLVFVGSFSCDGKRMDALCGAVISGEKCFGTFYRTHNRYSQRLSQGSLHNCRGKQLNHSQEARVFVSYFDSIVYKSPECCLKSQANNMLKSIPLFHSSFYIQP